MKTPMGTLQRWLGALRRTLFGVLLVGTLAPQAQAGLFDAYDTRFTQTRYPIVLVHGLFGFDNIAGLDYFYGIPSALRSGGAKVYVAEVSAVNTTEVRGEQLLAQIKVILAATGAQKVNLIGHSHGGPTARYAAGVAPQWVASVTTVAGAHGGSKVADLISASAPAGSPQEPLVLGFIDLLGRAISWASGKPSSYPEMATGARQSLTTTGAAAFNLKFPDGLPKDCANPNGPELVNGVRYFSWTGNRPATNLLDPSDLALALISPVHGEANDGLMGVCRTRLGKHLGDYPQNHLDEVNQFFGLVDIFSKNPVTLYREQANRLKGLGL